MIRWMKVKEQALFERKTAGALGFDLGACIDEPLVIQQGEVEKVPLGVAVVAPDGGFLTIRSGTAGRGLSLANGVGVIDPDYRGELSALLVCSGPRYLLMPGDRVCQFVPLGATGAVSVLVDSLDETERGEGGFGSTGV